MLDTLLNFSPENPFISLFLLSFLASTVLPLGSEWLLAILIHQGNELTGTVFIAACGNYLGSCTTYLLGYWGSTFITLRLFRIDERDLQRAQNLYARFGFWSLLLSWLPVIGDPLCALAGVFRVGFLRYSILVFSGKLTRYFIVAYLIRFGTG